MSNLSKALNDIENAFKIGRMFQAKNSYDKAIDCYRDVCASMIDVLNEYPHSDMDVIPRTLHNLAEVCTTRKDFESTLAFMKLEKTFLSRIAHESEGEFDVSALGREMEKAFIEEKGRRKAATLEKTKRRIGREQQAGNVRKLVERMGERKMRLDESRIERLWDWMNDHPLVITLVLALLLIVMGCGMFKMVKSGSTELKKMHQSGMNGEL